MVDLETLGTAPDSIIVSIGAVTFTARGIEDEGYWSLHLDQPGRHVDLSTIKWWMGQNDAARAVFQQPVHGLAFALEDLGSKFDAETRIWSYGANFDEVLLSDAYRQSKRRTPWTYKNVRCFRTLRAMYPDVLLESAGTKHNALDDARWQTQLLLEIVKQKDIPLL